MEALLIGTMVASTATSLISAQAQAQAARAQADIEAAAARTQGELQAQLVEQDTVAQVQRLNAEAQAAEFNALNAEREAGRAVEAAAFEERRFREDVRRFQGRQRAAAAAAGITLSGSPLELVAESARDAELDALAIRFSGDVESARLMSQAALDRLAGRGARAAAETARAGGAREADLLRRFGGFSARAAETTGRVKARGAQLVGVANAASSLLTGGTRLAEFRLNKG